MRQVSVKLLRLGQEEDQNKESGVPRRKFSLSPEVVKYSTMGSVNTAIIASRYTLDTGRQYLAYHKRRWVTRLRDCSDGGDGETQEVLAAPPRPAKGDAPPY